MPSLKKTLAFLFVIGSTTWLAAQTSTTEKINYQSKLLSNAGIKRMVVATTKLATKDREADRTWTNESFFDDLGRTILTTNDGCTECQTVYEYDSITGLVAYSKKTMPNGFLENYMEYDSVTKLVTYSRNITQHELSESYTEYDDQNRRTVVETCTKGEESCLTYWFDYDEENTERMYKETSNRHLKYDKANHMRLQFTRESSKQLVWESFYSPEKILEETQKYRDGKYDYSLLYEYDEQGRLKNTWRQTGTNKQLYEAFEYNEKGRVSSRKTRVDFVNSLYPEKSFLLNTYEYDEIGLLIKYISGTTTKEYSYFTD